MITSKNRLSRRTMLRGAGVTASLPFLSAMLKPGESWAQDVPKRLVIFFSPGGVGNLYDEWLPGPGMTLSPLTAPLEPFKNKLTFAAGTDLKVAIEKGNQAIHPHNRGMGGVLTGAALEGGKPETAWAQGASLDQVVAKANQKETKFPSLEFASGYGTGKSAVGGPHSASSINYSASNMAVAPRQDPLVAFRDIFSTVQAGGGDPNSVSLQILDKVAAEYGKVALIVGQEDKMRIEQHMTLIAEARESAAIGANPDCVAPTTINMTPGFYDPKPFDAALVPGGDDGNSNANLQAGTEVPEKGKALTDLLVASLGCDLTRVGTMQWSDSEAKFMLSFLKDPATGQALGDHHHGYQHDRNPGGAKDILRVIHNWYYQNLAYLLGKMEAIKEPNGMTLLDNSLVVCVSELQHAPTHGQQNMPFLLAGTAGGRMATGRLLQTTAGTPHNHLLMSLAKLYGNQSDTFGDPDYYGTLPGLV